MKEENTNVGAGKNEKAWCPPTPSWTQIEVDLGAGGIRRTNAKKWAKMMSLEMMHETFARPPPEEAYYREDDRPDTVLHIVFKGMAMDIWAWMDNNRIWDRLIEGATDCDVYWLRCDLEELPPEYR